MTKSSSWSAGAIAALVVLLVLAALASIIFITWRIQKRRRHRRRALEVKMTQSLRSDNSSPISDPHSLSSDYPHPNDTPWPLRDIPYDMPSIHRQTTMDSLSPSIDLRPVESRSSTMTGMTGMTGTWQEARAVQFQRAHANVVGVSRGPSDFGHFSSKTATIYGHSRNSSNGGLAPFHTRSTWTSPFVPLDGETEAPVRPEATYYGSATLRAAPPLGRDSYHSQLRRDLERL